MGLTGRGLFEVEVRNELGDARRITLHIGDPPPVVATSGAPDWGDAVDAGGAFARPAGMEDGPGLLVETRTTLYDVSGVELPLESPQKVGGEVKVGSEWTWRDLPKLNAGTNALLAMSPRRHSATRVAFELASQTQVRLLHAITLTFIQPLPRDPADISLWDFNISTQLCVVP